MGTAKKAISGAEFLKRMNAAMKELATEYGIKVPAIAIPPRYTKFLEDGEYTKYESYSRDFYDSPHGFKFTDGYLITHFASSEGFDGVFKNFGAQEGVPEFLAIEVIDEDATRAFAFRPLTQLWGKPGKSSSIALFIDLSKPACPVYKVDEGVMRKLCPSLDAFLKSLTPPKR